MTETDPAKMNAFVAERIFVQVHLIKSLSFAVLSWIGISALLFVISDNAAFLTPSGSVFFFLGLFFLTPVTGIFVFLTQKAVYLYLRSRGRLPKTVEGFNKMSLIIKGCWLPFLFALHKYLFDLYYTAIASIL